MRNAGLEALAGGTAGLEALAGEGWHAIKVWGMPTTG
jgi:hypothetical protein